ncbi:Lrp/AsnC family transcriptional regulator [Streptomyces sp. NPDC051954]|uniref:Lrp/AsnC family transcriptional regulator n=1 Tax=unclassified Streptomyces TaxID=2593676 RepID=UPI00342C7115
MSVVGSPSTRTRSARRPGRIANGRATYADLAEHADISPLSARKRTLRLIDGAVLPTADVDLALLGITTEALLWITVAPGAMDRTAHALAAHPQVQSVVATTGPANLLAVVATTDLDALYGLMADSPAGLEHVNSLEVTPILMTYKRNRLPRAV